jgi:transcriptional regulator with XRE-family HTH domain
MKELILTISELAKDEQDVADRMHRRRAELDMSEDDLADALGSTIQQVRDWETGSVRIGVRRLMELTKILRVRPTFFFADEPPSGLDGEAGPKETLPPQSIFDSAPPFETVRLIRAFASVKDRKSRESIIELAEKMAEA